MKQRHLILALLLVAEFSARAATVTGNMLDIFGNAAGTSVRFVPSGPLAIGTNTYLDYPRSARITNGLFSVWLAGGFYDADFVPYTLKPIRVLVWPSDTNTYTFNHVATLAVNAAMFNGSNLTVQVAGSNGVASFNTRTGLVTLLSNDVVNALGFVPGTLTSPTQNVDVLNVTGDVSLTGTFEGDFVYPLLSPGAEATGKGNLWYWMASTKLRDMKVYTSRDGLFWSPATANVYDYRDPDYYTNLAGPTTPGSLGGPYAAEFVPYYNTSNQMFYGVYNRDPYNSDPNAQSLGVAQSPDATNWTQLTILWPNGKTNAVGRMFAAQWFEDDNGDTYIVYDYSIGGALAFQTYVIKRLDTTFTNWSEPVLVIPDSNGFDTSLIRNGDRYELYCYNQSEILLYTNNTLTSAFTEAKEVLSWELSCEGPTVMKFSSQYWRMYMKPCVGCSSAFLYFETFNAGETWTTTPVCGVADTYGIWFPAGILPPPYPMLNMMAAAGYPTTFAERWGINYAFNAPITTPQSNSFLIGLSGVTTAWSPPGLTQNIEVSTNGLGLFFLVTNGLIRGTSAWTPALGSSTNETLLGWWKADNVGSGNGNYITNWADSFGTNTLTPVDQNLNPRYFTNALNGLPIVVWEYSDMPLKSLGFPLQTNFTLFAVVGATNPPSGPYSIISSATNDCSVLWDWRVDDFSYLVTAFEFNSFATLAEGTTEIAQSAWSVLVLTCSGTNWHSYVNGAVDTLGTDTAPSWNAACSGATGILVGGRLTGVPQWYTGSGGMGLAEAGVYHGVLSNETRNRLIQYLANKWDISINP